MTIARIFFRSYSYLWAEISRAYHEPPPIISLIRQTKGSKQSSMFNCTIYFIQGSFHGVEEFVKYHFDGSQFCYKFSFNTDDSAILSIVYAVNFVTTFFKHKSFFSVFLFVYCFSKIFFFNDRKCCLPSSR